MASYTEYFHHGYLSVPKGSEIHTLLPTTTSNDVIMDNSGTTLTTIINNMQQQIEDGAGFTAITSAMIAAMVAGTWTSG